MGSKLGSLIDNIKRVKPAIVIDLATQAILKAKNISNKEFKFIFSKINQVEHRTNAEIEKVMSVVVEMILANSSQETVSDEVKSEIIHLFSGYKKTRNLIPLFRYVNKLILTNVPKNIKSAKSFKKNIAKTLIKDARARLEGRNKN